MTLQLAITLALIPAALAQTSPYALILDDPPVAERFASRPQLRSAAALDYRRTLRSRQETLRAELATRHVTVTGSVDTVLNAVFVTTTAARAQELRGLPGVQSVVEMRRGGRRFVNRATQLVNAPAAWDALGGVANAGAGIKIAIIDSGIDQKHPAFQDASLSIPAGFPICSGFDGPCSDYTNSKVIVARSYVKQIASSYGDPANPAAASRPDDYTPRDRDGHGTADASVAAAAPNSGSVTFNGAAPKAWLGNYKVFGSPGVNDNPLESVVISAINDAVTDGMDVVLVSSGFIANSAPANSPIAQACENAIRAGTIVVAAVGDDGAENSIATPADASDVIAVGATTNSHTFLPAVSVPGSDLPSLLKIATIATDAPAGSGALTAPLVDVTQIGNDGYVCSALAAGSLPGSIALIARGPIANPCSLLNKLAFAKQAGALGVIFYNFDQSVVSILTGFYSAGLSGPAVMVSNSDGLALKSFIADNPGHSVTIDPGGAEQDLSGSAGLLASYSSFGPSTGDAAIKPELVAPGGLDRQLFLQGAFALPVSGMYVAAQSYDPQGQIYSSNGYAVVDGTSFAAPLVAGAAALVKQQNPGFTPAQVKSALVNTATTVASDDFGNPVDVQFRGNGKLDAGAAVSVGLVANPATISFGSLTSQGIASASKTVTVTNTGANALTLQITVGADSTGSGVTPTLDKSSLPLQPGASGTFNLSLRGSSLRAGSWSGSVILQGSGEAIRIPYLYMSSDGNPANLIPQFIPKCGQYLDGEPGQDLGSFQFKLLDQFGLPITNQSVTFAVNPTNFGTLQNASTRTDSLGFARAELIAGSSAGNMAIVYTLPNLQYQAQFPSQSAWFIRAKPTIASNGIVGAGNSDPAAPIAPGSLIAINGARLSDVSSQATGATLPLVISLAQVSFDVPGANISVPGHLVSVSPTQIVAQAPWELAGQTSAQVKVTINCSYGNVVTIPLANYAPAWFESIPGTVNAIDTNGQAINAGNPAQHGQKITLFANGLGPVSNQPASGDAGPASPAAQTTTTPAVTIGSERAQVVSSGLVPGVAGRYQIVVTVPADLSAGTVPVAVAIGGSTSPASNLPVQ